LGRDSFKLGQVDVEGDSYNSSGGNDQLRSGIFIIFIMTGDKGEGVEIGGQPKKTGRLAQKKKSGAKVRNVEKRWARGGKKRKKKS